MEKSGDFLDVAVPGCTDDGEESIHAGKYATMNVECDASAASR